MTPASLLFFGMSFLSSLTSALSPYAHPFEKTVDRYFASLTGGHRSSSVEKKIHDLMQENLAVLHLWCERRYKGYSYLDKDTRRKLLMNLAKIESAFSEFLRKNTISLESTIAELNKRGLLLGLPEEKKAEFLCLASIMSFLASPASNYYYEKAKNFGELLRDPAKEKLIGDCNQIVSLAAYLFSRKYDIGKLGIKTFPGHVCLHYEGVDAEATTGRFCRYEKEGMRVFPITELISVNLLDVTDEAEHCFAVSPKTFLEGARLASALSSYDEIVKGNLRAAYQKVINHHLKTKRFESALEHARMSGDAGLIEYAAEASAIEFIKLDDFYKAKKSIPFIKNEKIKKYIHEAEGIFLFKRKDFDRALEIFRFIGNPELEKRCYLGKYLETRKKISTVKTREDLKKKISVLREMRSLAEKSGDENAKKEISNLMKQAS